MTRRFGLGVVMACVVLVSFSAAQGKPQTWTGWIYDDHCPAKGAKAEHKSCGTKCLDKDAGKVVLHDRENSRHYSLILDNPQAAARHINHKVRVIGTVDAETITVESISEIK